ncbi:MAG: LemA family protein [Tepidisphaeraceae bacterium]
MSPVVPIVIFVVLVLIPGIWLIAIYNRFAKLKQTTRESWADIDVELKRRYDLIPNLVSTVKGYATHERETLERVVELRNKAAASTGSPASQSVDENALMLGLRQLMVVAEGYPQLKADANFRALQEELANTEDRIAAARRFYNANVRELNQMCQTVPTNIVAGLFGIQPQTYFEIDDQQQRTVPHVSLS